MMGNTTRTNCTKLLLPTKPRLQRVAAYRSVLQCAAGCCSDGNTTQTNCTKLLLPTMHRLQCVAVCCSVLQWVAESFYCPRHTGCSVLLCVAVCCSVLKWVAQSFYCPRHPGCSVLHHIEMCCSVRQCVAECCSVLKWVAVCCSESNKYSIIHHRQTTHSIHGDAQVAVCCSVVYCSVLYSVLQGVAGCCSVLYWVAVCCSVSRKYNKTHLRQPTHCI